MQYFLTLLTQASQKIRKKSTRHTQRMQLTPTTQRPKLKDRSGAYSCVASVAFVALRTLRALRWMQTGFRRQKVLLPFPPSFLPSSIFYQR